MFCELMVSSCAAVGRGTVSIRRGGPCVLLKEKSHGVPREILRIPRGASTPGSILPT